MAQGNLGNIWVSLVADASPMRREIKSAQGFISKHGVKMGAAMGAAFALGLSKYGIEKALESAFVLEPIMKQFETLAGSTRGAAKEFEFLTEVADKNAISIEENAASYTRLAIGFQKQGLGAQVAREAYIATANAAATLGLSAAETNGVLVAFSQIASKGKVSSEELIGQIGERVPGAFQIAADAMNMTTQELMKNLEQGNIMADEFLPKFTARMAEAFGGDIANKTDTMRGALTRLKNELLLLGDAFVGNTGINTLFKEFLNLLASGARGAKEFFQGISEPTTTEELTEMVEKLKQAQAEVDRLASQPYNQAFPVSQLAAAEQKVKAYAKALEGIPQSLEKASKLVDLKAQMDVLQALAKRYNKEILAAKRLNTVASAEYTQGLEGVRAKISEVRAEMIALRNITDEAMSKPMLDENQFGKGMKQFSDMVSKATKEGQAAGEKQMEMNQIHYQEILDANKEMLKQKEKDWDQYSRNVESMMGGVSSSIVGLLTGAERSFNDILKRMATSLLESQLTDILTQLALSMGGGGSGTFGGIMNAFAGAFATGGTMSPGTWGLVGENGPELAFAGAQPLSITPLDGSATSAQGAGATTVVNNITFTTDVKSGVRQEINSMMPMITKATRASVNEANYRRQQ